MQDANSTNIAAITNVEQHNELAHGLLWLDENLRVQGHNQIYRQLLEIESGCDSFIGQPYHEVLETLHQRGEFASDDGERIVREHLNALRDGKPLNLERIRPNGVALSVSSIPLPTGGYVYIFRDVSEARRLREALRRNAKASIIAMANLAEHRDADTGIHVLRVARLVSQTARKLMHRQKYAKQIDEAFIDLAATASILHDVGKITTPDNILLKNGPLTPVEREAIKQHTIVGAQLLQQAKLTMGENPYLDMGTEIARTHHEWFDGKGYPHALAGNDIPLAGRICAIADVFDALTSRRPYKAPWETQKAIALIHGQSGSQFDPDVVAAFLEVVHERENVCLVRWTDAMSVGHWRIDEQHRILIDAINHLASADSLHNHYAVSLIIDELLTYAAFHFDFEEKLLASANYPALDEHRRSHQYFVQWVEDFRNDYVTYGKQALGEPVLSFLTDWLGRHIMEEDQRYRPAIETAQLT